MEYTVITQKAEGDYEKDKNLRELYLFWKTLRKNRRQACKGWLRALRKRLGSAQKAEEVPSRKKL